VACDYLCPRSIRKMARAINTKLGTNAVIADANSAKKMRSKGQTQR